MNPLRKNNPISMINQAKLDDELINPNLKMTPLKWKINHLKCDHSKPGNNLCKFGTHNPDYNKHKSL